MVKIIKINRFINADAPWSGIAFENSLLVTFYHYKYAISTPQFNNPIYKSQKDRIGLFYHNTTFRPNNSVRFSNNDVCCFPGF